MMAKLSMIVPTYKRSNLINELFENIENQKLKPSEIIIVDGTLSDDFSTEAVVREKRNNTNQEIIYLRHKKGTSTQRNAGIEIATGDYLAFIDDDIRLDNQFFKNIIEVFQDDIDFEIGGVTGYIENQFLDFNKSIHWRIYKTLKLFTTYNPGSYDYVSGYPINRYLQPPHEENRLIDFMGAGCVVWRKEVLLKGLRFSEYFTGYGVLEDAHFALRARKNWKLIECGKAKCKHLRSPIGRVDNEEIAFKSAVNYRYVFLDIVPEITIYNEFRFWLIQLFDLVRFILYFIIKPKIKNWLSIKGKVRGIIMATNLRRDNYKTQAF
tara:strand:+ start:2625 stop:3593 length:969 start_codon:yes stop_codon:yes gene_type:complete